MKKHILWLVSIAVIVLMNIACGEATGEYASQCTHSTHMITQEAALRIAVSDFEHSAVPCCLYTNYSLYEIYDNSPSQFQVTTQRITLNDGMSTQCGWMIRFRHEYHMEGYPNCGVCYFIDADSGSILIADCHKMPTFRQMWEDHYGSRSARDWTYEQMCFYDSFVSCDFYVYLQPQENEISMDEAIIIARNTFLEEGAYADELDNLFTVTVSLSNYKRDPSTGTYYHAWWVTYAYVQRPQDKGVGWSAIIDANTGEVIDWADPDTMD